MKIARVTGTVVSTVKYEKYRGYKLLKVRHLTLEGEMTGEELIALDAADAGIGDIVLVNNDGGLPATRRLSPASPSAAWWTAIPGRANT